MNFLLLRRLPLLAVLLTLGLPSLTHAATLTVPSTAYPTIQSGINAAQSGDTVLVADGKYTGPGNVDLDFGGRNITVKSVNGPTSTIIDCGGHASTDGSGNHRGFYIHSGETSAVIGGFTVENGYENSLPGVTDHATGSGGGIYIGYSSANVQNCIITANNAQLNGGGLFDDNTGLYKIALTNCTISGNVAHNCGGGVCNRNLYSGSITLTNCIVSNNTIYGVGGGICNVNDSGSGSTIILVDCAVFGNNANGEGGGIANENYGSHTISLTNCTIFGNSASIGGGGVWYRDDGGSNLLTMTNDILYGDTGGEVVNKSTSAPKPIASYSDIQGGYAGTGNINADPLFVNVAAGDLHLTPGSPCLGAGTPSGAPPTDLDGRTRPSRPSMGAYELGTTLNVPSQYPTIQAGIDAARPGDTVLVADGTYTGDGNRDIDFHGKNLTVKSVNGPAKTVIDCGGYASTDGSGNHRGFYIHSREQNVTIRGFTVKNGYQTSIPSIPDSGLGGGVYNNNVGGTITLTDCTITASTAQYHGGGVYNVNGSGTTTLINCTLAANTAQEGYGAGIYNVNGSGTITLTKCTVAANIGQYYSGIYNGNSGGGAITLTDCTITANTARSGSGGGVYNLNLNGSTTTLTDCTITANTARSGGGVYNDNSEGHGSTITLTNCTLAANTAQDGGGGVYNVNRNSTVTLTNCTITANIAHYYGGGVYNNGTITLTNDIIYGDTGGEVYNYFSTPAISYSDIQGGYAGTGNIDADPLFVNAAAGDLHLKPGSPCLGAGTPNGAPPTDLDGTPRPNPPSMGAYELAPAPAAITAFTLSPSQVAAIGPNITVAAAVTASGTFGKVTVSPAPGMLGSASPTFTLTNSGAAWTGVIPTAYLKLARANPITFIATGTRADGTTATATATLIVGALPALSLAVSNDKSAVPAGRTFSVKGFVRNLTAVIATPVTVTIPLPTYLSFVSSPDFTFNSAQNTLTWTGPLAANSGSHAISVEFKASANTPTDKQIAISVTASAPDFQSITQSASIVVGAPPAPVGVDIDSTRAAGQADGTAIITSAVGATPLQAIISPVSGLRHAWLGVDYAYDAGGGQLAPTTDVSVGTLAAIMGVAGPGASPTYAASFPRIGSQCNIGLRFNDVSAGLNIGSIVVSALSGILGAKKGDPTEVFEFYNEFRKIRAFKDAADQLMHPATTPVGKAKQAAHIVKDFLNLNFNELDTLAIYLSGKTGKVITAVGVKDALKAVGRVESIVEIGQIIVDEISFTISTGGADAEITFTGSAVRHPDQLR